MEPVFIRHAKNPIIKPADLPFPAAAVLNPGATIQDDETVLLLRVEDRSGHSSIYVARSKNGVDGWRIEKEPILRYGEPRWRYEQWGCEDPRVTYLADENCWYITYTAYSPYGPAVAIARTTDLVKAQRIGLIFSPNNKDAALFPEKFDGRWAVLHRPAAGDIEHIWIAYSPDLKHWGEPHCLIPERGGAAWDGVKVGTGPPPILTDKGWLLIYHGVKQYGPELIYRVGAALLDRNVPHRVIARCSNWLFGPETHYEFTGLVPNVVFPTGAVLKGEELWMYYGAADFCVCLAVARLKDLLNALEVC